MTAAVGIFEWRLAPLAALNERLVVFADGTTTLLATRPRTAPSAVGLFAGAASSQDVRLLVAAGPGPVVFTGGESSDLFHAAERAAAGVRDTPRSVVDFRVRVSRSTVSLYGVAIGDEAVAFQLDTDTSAVHVRKGDTELAEVPFPVLETGFMTADAEGLGGVGRMATLGPGTYGAIAFEAELPPGGDAVVLTVAGSLPASLSGGFPESFVATTEPARLD